MPHQELCNPPTARELILNKRWEIGFICISHALAVAVLYASLNVTDFWYWPTLALAFSLAGSAFINQVRLGISQPYAPIGSYNCEEIADWARSSPAVFDYLHQVKTQKREISYSEYKMLKSYFYEEKHRAHKVQFYGY